MYCRLYKAGSIRIRKRFLVMIIVILSIVHYFLHSMYGVQHLLTLRSERYQIERRRNGELNWIIARPCCLTAKEYFCVLIVNSIWKNTGVHVLVRSGGAVFVIPQHRSTQQSRGTARTLPIDAVLSCGPSEPLAIDGGWCVVFYAVILHNIARNPSL